MTQNTKYGSSAVTAWPTRFRTGTAKRERDYVVCHLLF